MTRRCLLSTLGSLPVLAAATGGAEMAPLPRRAAELDINMVDGSHLLLSSFRGKIVVLELLFTTCPHCQHEAQMLSKLYSEYKSRGVQMIGAAYNDMSKMLVPDFIKENNVNFPVGYISREQALSFLTFEPGALVSVPQLALIDRQGVIQKQTPPRSDIAFTQEQTLRPMIEELLKLPAAPAHRAAARKKAG